MPIYEITPLAASQNKFIDSLYKYKKSFELAENKYSSKENKRTEVVALFKSSFQYYKDAIFHAVKVAKDNSNPIDQRDFQQWLVSNKIINLGIVMQFSEYFQILNEERLTEEADNYLVELYDNIEKISISEEKSNSNGIAPSDFPYIINDIKNARGNAESRPTKRAVVNKYAQLFYNFLRKIINQKMISYIEIKENLSFIQNNGRILKNILDQHGTSEQRREFDEQYNPFLVFSNRKVRAEEINKLVDKSVELRAHWANQGILLQLKERLANTFNKVWKEAEAVVRRIQSRSFWEDLWVKIKKIAKDVVYVLSFVTVVVPIGMLIFRNWEYFTNVKMAATNLMYYRYRQRDEIEMENNKVEASITDLNIQIDQKIESRVVLLKKRNEKEKKYESENVKKFKEFLETLKDKNKETKTQAKAQPFIPDDEIEIEVGKIERELNQVLGEVPEEDLPRAVKELDGSIMPEFNKREKQLQHQEQEIRINQRDIVRRVKQLDNDYEELKRNASVESSAPIVVDIRGRVHESEDKQNKASSNSSSSSSSSSSSASNSSSTIPIPSSSTISSRYSPRLVGAPVPIDQEQKKANLILIKRARSLVFEKCPPKQTDTAPERGYLLQILANIEKETESLLHLAKNKTQLEKLIFELGNPQRNLLFPH